MTVKCERCDGCGKIANSETGEPWTAWLSMPIGSSAAVLMGTVKPISCPECGGAGKLLDFAQHIDAENNSAEPMTPEPIPADQDRVQWLIDRVTAVIPESMQMGTEPLSTKAAVLAQLYQAQALRDMAEQLHEISGSLESGLFSRRNAVHRRRHRSGSRNSSRFARIFRDMADAVEDLE